MHSSLTMRLHWLRTSARAVPLEMLQVGASARDRLRGSLKTECAVLPPERRVAAIPGGDCKRDALVLSDSC